MSTEERLFITTSQRHTVAKGRGRPTSSSPETPMNLAEMKTSFGLGHLLELSPPLDSSQDLCDALSLAAEQTVCRLVWSLCVHGILWSSFFSSGAELPSSGEPVPAMSLAPLTFLPEPLSVQVSSFSLSVERFFFVPFFLLGKEPPTKSVFNRKYFEKYIVQRSHTFQAKGNVLIKNS